MSRLRLATRLVLVALIVAAGASVQVLSLAALKPPATPGTRTATSVTPPARTPSPRPTATATAPVPTPTVTPAPATQAPQPSTTAPPRAQVQRPLTAAAPPRPPAPRPPVWGPSSLHSADGRLNVGVGVYADCSGRSRLTASEAALDVCVTSVRWYFVGHHPGPFSPMMYEGVGSVITYVDGGGVQHALRIVATRDVTWYPGARAQPPVSGNVVAQFQTCLNADGTLDRIFDAVPA